MTHLDETNWDMGRGHLNLRPSAFSSLEHHGGWWKGWRLLIDTVSPPPPPLPHRAHRFVLLMTPSRYDLIQFALGNWWHTDTLLCRRRGWHTRGRGWWAGGGGGFHPIVNIPPWQIRYCYWSLTAVRVAAREGWWGWGWGWGFHPQDKSRSR